MKASHLPRSLSLALAGFALAATACADVGSGSTSTSDQEFPVVQSTDQDVIVCQSIRQTMQKDAKAAKAAEAAGNKAEADLKNAAVRTGAEGAKTVKGCDVSDLLPGAPKPSPS
jgi:hypothetical protein